MDDGELRQLVIGLVTQIYYADRDGRDAYDPEVAAGLTTLVQDPHPGSWSGLCSFRGLLTSSEL